MVPRPPSKPKATIEAVTAEALRAWRRVHESEPLPDLFVLGCRSYYRDSMGKPGQNDLSQYDDSFFIVSPPLDAMTSWNGNTDPSRYGWNAGAGKYMARLKPGVWKMITRMHRGKYQAYGQGENPVTVERIKSDGSIAETETGRFGIDLHLGGNNGTSSEGCQTVPPEQWEAFRKTLNSALHLHHASFFHYILIDGPIA
jgi:lysozyme